MRDPFRWSIGLGRWGVPTVRLHAFFLLFAAATYFLCWQDTSSAPGSLVGVATVTLVILLLSVLAHEWSHWVVARRYGMAPETLVIGPLGGVSQWPAAGSAWAALASTLAGPGANLVIGAVCLLLLPLFAGPVAVVALLNPLRPLWAEGSTPLLQQGLQLTLWVNWLLFLVNLLPAFPFDGGRILRSLLSLARPRWPKSRVGEVVFWVAVTLSAVLLAAALAALKYQTDALFPSSFALFLLAVVLLVSARRDADSLEAVEEEIDTELEEPWPVESACDDAAAPYADAEEPMADCAQWAAPADVAPEPAPEDVEADEERRVDAILGRLHNQGMNSLTADERRLLERVSARYRSRLGRQA
jgi:Zn-dependent protease